MYIDPNSGGMLFQLLIVLFSVFSGVLLVFSGRIRAFMGKFRRRFRKNDEGTVENKIDQTKV